MRLQTHNNVSLLNFSRDFLYNSIVVNQRAILPQPPTFCTLSEFILYTVFPSGKTYTPYTWNNKVRIYSSDFQIYTFNSCLLEADAA